MYFLKRENLLSMIISIGLVVFAIIVQKQFTRYMYLKSKEITKPLNIADSIQYENLKANIDVTDLKQKTLISQYQISQEIKSCYKEMAVTYYVNYYAFSLCSILFTTFLTIAVFLVVNSGWQSSSIFLKTFLLTSVVLSSIYYFLPNVLNNKENLEKNIEKVKEFQKIQSGILSFSNGLGEATGIKIDSAIQSNYTKIVTNYDFIATIDNSNLNTNPQDILKSIKP